MGLLDSFMRGRVDLMNPQAATERRRRAALMEQRGYQEQQRLRGIDYAKMLQGVEGQAAVPGQSFDPTAVSPEEFAGLPPEMQAEYGTQDQAAVEGTGLRGGLLTPTDVVSMERFNPYKGAQTTGPNLATMMGRTEPGQGPVTFDQYMNFSPQRQAGFDKFKGRNRGPLVTVQTGNNQNPKPGDIAGLVPVQDPATGEWSYKSVPQGPYDPKGYKNVQKESTEYRAAVRPLMNANDSLKNYEELVTKLGTVGNPYSAKGKQLAQAQTTALMDLKNVLELGVLSGPDEVLLNKILPSGAGVISYALASPEQVTALIKRARKGMVKRGTNFQKQYPNATIADDDIFTVREDEPTAQRKPPHFTEEKWQRLLYLRKMKAEGTLQ